MGRNWKKPCATNADGCPPDAPSFTRHYIRDNRQSFCYTGLGGDTELKLSPIGSGRLGVCSYHQDLCRYKLVSRTAGHLWLLVAYAET